MVCQAQVDCGDPEGGHDQRGLRPRGHRRRQQVRRRRHGLAGTRGRRGGHGLRHRDRHGLGRRSTRVAGETSSRREGHPGTRLHRHGRNHQCRGCLARLIARPCLRQCPPAAHLDTQSRPHDSPLCRVGGAGTGRALRCAPLALWQDRGLDPVPGCPCMSATWGTRLS